MSGVSEVDVRFGGKGKVWIVSAGPGDADLLTVKALRVLQQVDVILYDNLVSADIRALFPKGTPAIYVGKKKDLHSIPQDQLNQLLASIFFTVCICVLLKRKEKRKQTHTGMGQHTSIPFETFLT